MTDKCIFDLAWTGPCKQETVNGEYCKNHSVTKCCVCGEQATHECGETFMLVCGAPLCDNCEHSQDTSPEDWFIHVKREQ